MKTLFGKKEPITNKSEKGLLPMEVEKVEKVEK